MVDFRLGTDFQIDIIIPCHRITYCIDINLIKFDTTKPYNLIYFIRFSDHFKYIIKFSICFGRTEKKVRLLDYFLSTFCSRFIIQNAKCFSDIKKVLPNIHHLRQTPLYSSRFLSHFVHFQYFAIHDTLYPGSHVLH